jgi:hypothetical protein
MMSRVTRVLLLAWLASAVSYQGLVAQSTGGAPAVIAHEWGTFTTVAGPDGEAQEWLPLGGPTDLPCFVEHYQNRREVKVLPTGIIVPPAGPQARVPDSPVHGRVLDYKTARAGLQGKVRMETPVVYFYADTPAVVDVTVRFSQGLFTEWYPSAAVAQSPSYERILRWPSLQSFMRWPEVQIRPKGDSDFPTERAPSHYYAARETDASPIRVGGQNEKFLFYRGVGGFDVPLAAAFDDAGHVWMRNTGTEPLPGVMLFRSEGGRLGYRLVGTVTESVLVQEPELDDTLDELRRDLEAILVAQGLYRREAQAMIETWRDTWFEDGTRVFYVQPRADVDRILPLAIEPAPAAVARVFVGRMDLISPQSVADVRRALHSNDRATFARYGRLLDPIGRQLLVNATPSEKTRLEQQLEAAFQAMLERTAGGC